MVRRLLRVELPFEFSNGAALATAATEIGIVFPDDHDWTQEAHLEWNGLAAVPEVVGGGPIPFTAKAMLSAFERGDVTAVSEPVLVERTADALRLRATEPAPKRTIVMRREDTDHEAVYEETNQ